MFRLLLCLLAAIFVYYTPDFKNYSPGSYYASLFVLMIFKSAVSIIMFIAKMAIFASVSDPLIGGTYITFLTTISNLGSKYPETINLYLIDLLSIKTCWHNPKRLMQMANSTYFGTLNSTLTVNGTTLTDKCSSSAQLKVNLSTYNSI